MNDAVEVGKKTYATTTKSESDSGSLCGTALITDTVTTLAMLVNRRGMEVGSGGLGVVSSSHCRWRIRRWVGLCHYCEGVIYIRVIRGRVSGRCDEKEQKSE